MTPTKIRSLFIASALLILVLALSFGAVLTSGSFTKGLTQSYVSSFAINGGESVRKIEYALKYGKQLDNFFGIQSILQEVKLNNPEVQNVKVILADGSVAYSLLPGGENSLTGRLLGDFKQMMRETGDKKTSWRVVDHNYNVLLDIRDPSGKRIGAMDVLFPESVVAPFASAFESSIFNQTFIVGIVVALLLVGVLSKMQIVDAATGNLRTARLLAVTVLFIGIAQSIVTSKAIIEFQPVYRSAVQRNHQLVGQLVQKNLQKVVAKGVPYADLEKLDEWLDAIPKATPEIESIVLANKAGSIPLYSTRRTDSLDNAQYVSKLDPTTVTRVGLAPDTQAASPEAIIALSKPYIDRKNRDIVVDAVTLLVTTLIFSVEIVLFLGIYFRHQAAAHAAGVPTSRVPGDVAIVRPQAFVFFLAASMASSFLPIILNGFDPIEGVPQNIFLGLPLTVEIFASILSTMVTGVILDRRGWRPPFFAGLLTVAAGMLLSALATSTWVFLLARLIVGIGYGFAWMSMRGFVAGSKTLESQTSGFAGLNSGIYAGINCGVILGALLLDRLDYSGIFWMSLLLMGVAIAFCLAFTTNQAPAQESEQVLASAGTLLSDKNIFLFLVTVAVPTAVCLMFLNYFVPVYSIAAGISAGDVGRLFLLYGLCVVYLGPLLSRTVIQKYSSKVSTAFSFLLIIAGLILFGFFPNPLNCAVAVVLLGLSDGIGLVAQNNYYLSFKSVRAFGVGKSMSVFSIVKKVGQTMGTLVFSWLSVTFLGIAGLGVVFGLALIAFMVTAPFPEKAARG